MKSSKIIIAAAALALSSDALAYRYFTCQDKKYDTDSTPTYQAGTNSFASQNRRDSLLTARNRWNEIRSKYSVSVSWNHNVSSTNYQDEVWYTSDADLLDGAPAKALFKWACFAWGGELYAVDVIMNNGVQWMNYNSRKSANTWGGDFRPAQTTLLHEIGHSLGLAHSNTRYNIMGQDWTVLTSNNDEFRSYAAEDAAKGAVFLHGDEVRPPDFSVTAIKYSQASGEYSQHTWTRVIGAEGDDYWSASDQERVFRVKRGKTYGFEFTYENNGTNPNTVAVGVDYVVSVNRNITNGDTKIGSRVIDLGFNAPYTGSYNLTIPNNLEKGKKYYIGAIMDPGNFYAEISGANNYAYIPVLVID